VGHVGDEATTRYEIERASEEVSRSFWYMTYAAKRRR